MLFGNKSMNTNLTVKEKTFSEVPCTSEAPYIYIYIYIYIVQFDGDSNSVKSS